MKKLLYSFLIILMACQPQTEQIVYSDSELERKDSSNIVLEKICSGDFFVQPKKMEIIGDSLSLIFDNQNGDNVCHLLNMKGELLMSFGEKGRSEMELISPQNISLSPNNDSVYIYDYQLMKVLGFNISEVLISNSKPSCEVLHMDNIITTRYNGIYYIGEKMFLGWGNNENRFTIIKNSKVLSVYKKYPPVDPDNECTWSIWGNLAQVSISPNRRYLVATTEIGALIEIFELHGEKIESKVLKAYYEPNYSFAQGAKPKCVISNEKTIDGFRCLYLTDDNIFTTMGGPRYEHLDEILVYDYDGRLQQKLKTNAIIVNLAVTSDGTLMILAYDKKMEELSIYRSKINI